MRGSGGGWFGSLAARLVCVVVVVRLALLAAWLGGCGLARWLRGWCVCVCVWWWCGLLQVARHLFEQCIGRTGSMVARNPRCTRVLVTHQVQFLGQCDLVCVVDAGRVKAVRACVRACVRALL